MGLAQKVCHVAGLRRQTLCGLSPSRHGRPRQHPKGGCLIRPSESSAPVQRGGCCETYAAELMPACNQPSGCRCPEAVLTKCGQCPIEFHRVCCGASGGSAESDWDYCRSCSAGHAAPVMQRRTRRCCGARRRSRYSSERARDTVGSCERCGDLGRECWSCFCWAEVHKQLLLSAAWQQRYTRGCELACS